MTPLNLSKQMLVPNSLQNLQTPAQGTPVDNATSRWQTTVAQAKTSTFEKFTGLFKTPTRRDDQYLNAASQFKAAFHEQVRTLGRDLSPDARAALTASASAKYAEIVSASMAKARGNALSRNDGQVSLPVLRQAITGANLLAAKAMMELQVEVLQAKTANGAGAASIRPQAYNSKNSDGTTSINLIRQAPQIENLVIRGGGAKGVSLGTALVEMDRGGMLSGLQRVVGTSAGALTAVGLASGFSAAQFQSEFGNIDMEALERKPENFEALYPQIMIDPGVVGTIDAALGMVTTATMVGKALLGAALVPKDLSRDLSQVVKFLAGPRTAHVAKHAGAALQTLDKASAGNVARYLQANWNTEAFQTKLAAQGPEAALRLGQLRDQNFATDRTNQMITFKDLHILHTIDPARFKELTLTGFNDSTKTEKYFDFASTPDMPVALAGRISMSIPIFFGAVNYEMDGQVSSFVDGGVGSNMPSEAVFKGVTRQGGLGSGQATEQTRARTALVGFDENGLSYTAMHGGSVGLGREFERFMRGLATGTNMRATSNADMQKLQDAGPNGLVVFHGDIGTLDLDASSERVTMAQLGAQMRMLEQVEARQNQAYAVNYHANQARECFESLNDTERAALVAGGPPARPRSGASDAAANFQMALYEMAMLARPSTVPPSPGTAPQGAVGAARGPAATRTATFQEMEQVLRDAIEAKLPSQELLDNLDVALRDGRISSSQAQDLKKIINPDLSATAAQPPQVETALTARFQPLTALNFMYRDEHTSTLGSIYQDRARAVAPSTIFTAPVSQLESANVTDILRGAISPEYRGTDFRMAIPVHSGARDAGHWTGVFVKVDRTNKKIDIQSVDSLGSQRPMPQGIKDALQQLFSDPASFPDYALEFRAVEPAYQQGSTLSCGPCTMENLLHLATDAAPPVAGQATDMSALRQRQAQLLQEAAS